MSDDEELQRLREAALRSKKKSLNRKGNNSVPSNLVGLSKDNCSNPAALLNKDISLTAFTHEDWRSGFIESIKKSKPKNYPTTPFITPSLPQSLPSNFTQSFITSCITTSTIQQTQVFTTPLNNEIQKYPQQILVPQQSIIPQQLPKPIQNAGFLLNPQGIPVLQPFIQPPLISHQPSVPIHQQKTPFFTHSPHKKHYTRPPNDKGKLVSNQRSNLIVVPVDNYQQTPPKSEANVKNVPLNKVIVSTASSTVTSSFSRPQDKWSNTATKLEEKSHSKSKKSKFDRFDDSATSDDDDDNDEEEEEDDDNDEDEEEDDDNDKNDKNEKEIDNSDVKTETKIVEKNELEIVDPKVSMDNMNTDKNNNGDVNKQNKLESIEKHKNISIKPKNNDVCVGVNNNNNENSNNNNVKTYNSNINAYSSNNVTNSYNSTLVQPFNNNNNMLTMYGNNSVDDAYISPCTSDEEEVIKKYTNDIHNKCNDVNDECDGVKADLNGVNKHPYKTDAKNVDAKENIRSKIVNPKINTLKSQKRSNSVNNGSKSESMKRLKSPSSLGSHSGLRANKYKRESVTPKNSAASRNYSDEDGVGRVAYVDKTSMIAEESDHRRYVRRKRRSRSREHQEFQDKKNYEGKSRRSFDERSRHSDLSDDRNWEKRELRERYKYSPIPYNYSESHLNVRDGHHENIYHHHSKRLASDKHRKNHREYYNGNYYDFRSKDISPESERVALRVGEKNERHHEDYGIKRDCYSALYDDYNHQHYKYHRHDEYEYRKMKELSADKYKRHKEYSDYYEDMECFNERYNRDSNLYNGRCHRGKESYRRMQNGNYARKRRINQTRSNSKENERSSSGCKDFKSVKTFKKHSADSRNQRRGQDRKPDDDNNDEQHSNIKIKKSNENCDTADSSHKGEKESRSNINRNNADNNKSEEISIKNKVDGYSHRDKNDVKTKENKEIDDSVLPESYAPNKGRRVVRRKDDAKAEKTLETVAMDDNGEEGHFTPSKVPSKSSVHERLGSKQHWKHKNNRKKTDLRNRIHERTKPSYM